MRGYLNLNDSFLILSYVSLISIIVFIACAPSVTSLCTNRCPDYEKYWIDTSCPAGERCITFKNKCSQNIYLNYQVGCNSDGNPGSPQCDCTKGPLIPPKNNVYWQIVNGNYSPCDCRSSSCNIDYTPDCLTEAFTVMPSYNESSLCLGNRIEFTAGNEGNPYGKFDSYDNDIEKGFNVSVSFAPDIACTPKIYWNNGTDCRSLWCGSINNCPDAYYDPYHGKCDRSPQAGCQYTFDHHRNDTPMGFIVEFCPANPTTNCQNSAMCSGGFTLEESLGGTIWIDSDKDNIYDKNEHHYPNVAVNLYVVRSGESIEYLGVTFANDRGHYRFTDLKNGDYMLEFVLPEGYAFVQPNQGTDDAIDSDADCLTGRTEIIKLVSGVDLTWYAGLIRVKAKKPITTINKQTIQVGIQSALATRGSAKNIIDIFTEQE
jgi:hypothetical protein